MQNSSTPNPIDSSASYNVKNPFRPNSWRRKRKFRNDDGKCKIIFSHCRRFPGACFCPWGTNGCHLEHPENALWHTRCLTPMFLWCVSIMRYFSIETNTLSFQLKFNFLNFCLLYFETDPNPLDSLSREMPGKSSMDQADPIMSTLHKEDVEADDQIFWEINGK